MNTRSALKVCAFCIGATLSATGSAAAFNGMPVRGSVPNLVYVVEPSASAVKIYRETGGSPVGSIPVTPSSHIGISADASGTVYISDSAAGTVGIYPSGATSPSLTLRIAEPDGVCADLQGTVYVTDNKQEVAVFPAGHSSPSRKLENPMESFASGSGPCALDAHGDLSVIFNFEVAGFYGNNIGQFPAGNPPGIGLFLRPPYYGDIAVDRAGNMLLNDLRHWIRVWSPNGGTVIGKVAYTPGGSDQAFAFDRTREHLFVNSTADPQEIKEYVYSRRSVMRTIQIDAPAAMFAVSPGPA